MGCVHNINEHKSWYISKYMFSCSWHFVNLLFTISLLRNSFEICTSVLCNMYLSPSLFSYSYKTTCTCLKQILWSSFAIGFNCPRHKQFWSLINCHQRLANFRISCKFESILLFWWKRTRILIYIFRSNLFK